MPPLETEIDTAGASAVEPTEAKEPADKAIADSEDLAATSDSVAAAGDDRGATTDIGLLADGPIDTYRTFWLSNPDRFVIDIPHRGAKTAKSLVAADHPFVERVRVGNHDDKVRFVLETKAAAPRLPDIRVEGNKMRVAFHQEP